MTAGSSTSSGVAVQLTASRKKVVFIVAFITTFLLGVLIGVYAVRGTQEQDRMNQAGSGNSIKAIRDFVNPVKDHPREPGGYNSVSRGSLAPRLWERGT